VTTPRATLAFADVWGKLRPVNFAWAHPRFGGRYGLAILAGLLLACSFPKIGIAGFAWIAPGLMIAAALGTEGAQTFRIGYLAGLTHYLTSFYWLLLIPYRWHGVPLGPMAGWLALSAVLALYPATWVWLITAGPKSQVPGPKSASRRGPQSTVHGPQSDRKDPSSAAPPLNLATDAPRSTAPSAILFPLSSPYALSVASPSWSHRTLWALSGAAVWVALEMLLARLFGGFPWDLLGVSQYQMLPLTQIASVSGIYGVSFLIVWFSLSLLSAALAMIRRPTARSVWISELFLPLLVVAFTFNLGFQRLHHAPAEVRTIRLTLIQPSIPQEVIWDATKSDERFQDLVALCRQALSNRTDAVVWPEAALPKLLRYDKETFETVTGLARDHRIWMILGADDAEPRRGSSNPDDADFYNSSFLINPEGRVEAFYRKRNLVIFGEYIPLARWLPFLKWFTPIEGGFTPGDHTVPFLLKALGVETSVLICFEDIFPQLGRQAVGPATDFLVNLTNDGWFGQSAAQWQHAATAVFRAIENGVPLIRCTNNGLTCWVDAHGRLREIFRDPQGTIYGPGFLTVEIPLPAYGEKHTQTFYNRHGDWLGWACVGLTILLLAFECRRRVQSLRNN
jgi:apolipoprotein N-acyltransferase